MRSTTIIRVVVKYHSLFISNQTLYIIIGIRNRNLDNDYYVPYDISSITFHI